VKDEVKVLPSYVGVRQGYQVVAAPVKEVEVIVVQQVGSIKDSFWCLRDGTEGLLDRPGTSVLRVQGSQRVLVSFRRSWSLQ
jgi:hypothetical protein